MPCISFAINHPYRYRCTNGGCFLSWFWVKFVFVWALFIWFSFVGDVFFTQLAISQHKPIYLDLRIFHSFKTVKFLPHTFSHKYSMLMLLLFSICKDSWETSLFSIKKTKRNATLKLTNYTVLCKNLAKEKYWFKNCTYSLFCYVQKLPI